MEKEFVTYEIALALKELGFDEPCFGYYGIENELNFEISCNLDHNLTRRNFMTAPLWQQVIDWLDSKNIFIDITYHKSGKFYVSVNNECDIPITNDLAFKKYDSRNQACEQAILKVIEIIKNN